MSQRPNKLDSWRSRGKRTLSIQEVEEVLSRFPMMRVPKHIIMLDGVIDLPQRQRIAVGATPFSGEFVIFTPLSDEETVVHESIHYMGLGEFATQILTKIQMMRMNFGIIPNMATRRVQYQLCSSCASESELLTQLQMRPSPRYEGLPIEIKHYLLVT